MSTRYELFKKYEVIATNVEDFLERYSKPAAHADRGEEYVQARIESFKEELRIFGCCFITHHDSVTGDIVAYYQKE